MYILILKVKVKKANFEDHFTYKKTALARAKHLFNYLHVSMQFVYVNAQILSLVNKVSYSKNRRQKQHTFPSFISNQMDFDKTIQKVKKIAFLSNKILFKGMKKMKEIRTERKRKAILIIS